MRRPNVPDLDQTAADCDCGRPGGGLRRRGRADGQLRLHRRGRRPARLFSRGPPRAGAGAGNGRAGRETPRRRPAATSAAGRADRGCEGPGDRARRSSRAWRATAARRARDRRHNPQRRVPMRCARPKRLLRELAPADRHELFARRWRFTTRPGRTPRRRKEWLHFASNEPPNW